MDSSSARRDALAAVRNDDCRLVAVYGFSTETPGADHDARQRLGYRAIEGTSVIMFIPETLSSTDALATMR